MYDSLPPMLFRVPLQSSIFTQLLIYVPQQLTGGQKKSNQAKMSFDESAIFFFDLYYKKKVIHIKKFYFLISYIKQI